MEKTRLLGKTPAELKEIALAAGLPGFTGKQIAQWIYGKRVRSIAEMTNISKVGRERLEELYEVGVALPLDKAESVDGTCKYLFPVNGDPGNAVEAVMIPDGDRKTLCVSSQAGCKMGCKFCMTGRQGRVSTEAFPRPTSSPSSSASTRRRNSRIPSSWAWANRWTTGRR